ncbi:2,3-bisphosphoglycerate-independent phosphoglycerate mutase [Olavius algarvensis spirochete endosymbiont]|uniref:2,3-bisphosphoglycerate-independent phosphoglycerate mutase n=1 Tax=Olavius algarvensis spirochete endosymbiont TaxID=260710 RepID=UPI00052CD0A7|nr:2,3-bisphosphoglycerate-independent phosphoglycerate mutase [Olavius algarvensis spirochete endosymbiont]KGM44321.1 phosphoglyceromutase [Alkalispirochaeta odontotermitis]CAD7840050.1 MAG: 2,3-bisphosphoglycerate-independent phosphoglycerate mutase (EC 5.4.2.12) [Olavius algarvensis spirochete endosymbiont]VDB00417.1 2,3-bisphosphoglycerate-independent phosphoglycerate mutase [Olavius algarvensis spirochete endosymbiont]
MCKALNPNSFKDKRKGSVVLCIMDGVALGKYEEGDAVKAAHTEILDYAMQNWPGTRLKAHGTSVGLPSDSDMGNSEVGHNAMGCGRVFMQGAKLVNNSIESGSILEGEVWKRLVSNVKRTDGAMHFIGLLSDGNVHSHIEHLRTLVLGAKSAAVSRVRVHGLLDGRDVGETSALDYFTPFEEFLSAESGESFDARFASGGGRMNITMDRYDANWSMVERGWKTHVLGEGDIFRTATEAIVALRKRTGMIDQDLPPFIVVGENGKSAGPILDGDSVVLFNFRGDRAIELSKAFEGGADFDKFDRVRIPRVEYAGMMEYDGDAHIPTQYLVSPPSIDCTMAEYLVASGVKQFSISETQKFGHVTYFWNGNRTGYYDKSLEEYFEIKSDIIPFEQRPAMKCAEIADKVIEVIDNGEFDLIKLNFPNGDMVGHTGNFQATLASIEVMDIQIGRIRDAVERTGGILILTADHGNSDDMFERNKKGEVVFREDGRPKPKTSHSLNPVPFLLYDPLYNGEYSTEFRKNLGISSVASTCINLLGYQAPENYDEGIIAF